MPHDSKQTSNKQAQQPSFQIATTQIENVRIWCLKANGKLESSVLRLTRSSR
jgi:hypothetical protein